MYIMIQNIQRIIRVSFGINRRLNHNLQIWVNTYVNPAELGANQSRVHSYLVVGRK